MRLLDSWVLLESDSVYGSVTTKQQYDAFIYFIPFVSSED